MKCVWMQTFFRTITIQNYKNNTCCGIRIWIPCITARLRSRALGHFRCAAPWLNVAIVGEAGDRATFRGVATVCALGSIGAFGTIRSQSGWVVGNVSVVCARANDRRETANVRRACMSWGASWCHDVRVSRGQRAQVVRGVWVSGTWRAIPGAPIRDASSLSTAMVMVAVTATVQRWGANWSWSFWRCCWRLSSLSRTPRVKVSH